MSVITNFSITFRISVRWSEKVNEIVLFLCPSWLVHALMRTNLQMNAAFCNPMYANSPLRVVFGMFCALSFRCSVARSSYGRFVLVSISRFELRILDFMLEVSSDHELQSAIVVFLIDECRLLSVDLQQTFQLFRLFNFHLVQTLQDVVSRSVSGCW